MDVVQRARARQAGLRGARVGHGIPAPVRPRPRRASRTTDCSALATAAYLAGDRERPTAPSRSRTAATSRPATTLAAVRDTFWLGLLYNTPANVAVGGGWVARGAPLLQDAARTRSSTATWPCTRCTGTSSPVSSPAALESRDAGRRDRSAVPRREPRRRGAVEPGTLLIYVGRVREGLALLDEAMVGLADPDVSPILAGHVVLLDGRGVPGDRRLPADGRVDHRPDPVVPDAAGARAVHRAVRGAPGADHAVPRRPARGARGARAGPHAVRRGGFDRRQPGSAHYERGEVLRVQGDLAGAAAAYEEAAALGRDPQPGQSLLALAKGNGAAAAARCAAPRGDAGPGAPQRACCRPRSRCSSRWRRRCRPVGRRRAARAGAGVRLRGAGGGGCLRGGSVAWLAGDGAGAGRPRRSPHLRRAWKLWIDLGARYEAAWARVRIGLACRALGDEESALVRARRGGRAFAEIGAEPARAEVERLLGRDLPDGLTAREVEVLRLVASGRSNPQIAQDLSSARRRSSGT